MHLSLEFSAVCLGTSTVGMSLSLLWYRVTQDGWPGRKTPKRIWVAHTSVLRVGPLTLPRIQLRICRFQPCVVRMPT